jgi:hypothetical protein
VVPELTREAADPNGGSSGSSQGGSSQGASKTGGASNGGASSGGASNQGGTAKGGAPPSDAGAPSQGGGSGSPPFACVSYGLTESIEGTTEGASDRGELGCNKSGGAPDVAIAFTAPETHFFSFTTRGSSFDTVISVALDGPCDTTLQQCDDDSDGTDSDLTIELTKDQTIRIVVDGATAADRGDFTLDVQTGTAGRFWLHTHSHGDGNCLATASAAPGPAAMRACENTLESRHWLVPQVGGGYLIHNEALGDTHCLDSNEAGFPANGAIRMAPCNDSEGQVWTFEDLGYIEPAYQLQPRSAGGERCVEGRGLNEGASVMACGEFTGTSWELERVPE